jgi:hypothetical protein
MAKMPFLSQPGKEHPDLRIADICCLIVAGEPGCCSTYAATVIGSDVLQVAKARRAGTNPEIGRWHDSRRS